MKSKPFSKEQDEWLKKHHYPDVTISIFTSDYNHFWNENRSVDTMKHHCAKLGLKQERRTFTQEQDEWLLERNRKYSLKDTTLLFNKTFGTSRSEGVMKVHCNKMLKVFFLNDHNREGLPIGSEKIIGEYVWVKISNENHGRGSFYSNWRQKSHIIWEQHHGCMPPNDYTIVFLDGNRKNFDISNLYAVSGRVNREMSKKNWWRTNPELTLAAIKWCELFYVIKDIRKEN